MTKDRSFLFLGRRWLILEETQKIGVGEGYDYGEEMRKMVSFSRLRGFCD